jgi:hypothetical protein
MFPNKVMQEPSTWNNVLAAIIKVRDAPPTFLSRRCRGNDRRSQRLNGSGPIVTTV